MSKGTLLDESRGERPAQIVAERATASSHELAPTPDGSMFERLLRDPGVDVEKLERFMAMQERFDANRAKAAFNAAFAQMLGQIPVIHEGGETNNGTYARLEDIIPVVRPILQEFGFALSHTTEWPDAKTVRVIGILMHRDGHERRSEFLSAADSSGNKNTIQGLGSALSYGRRYTTLDLLNIATKEDDDGKKAGQKAPEKAAPAGYDVWFQGLEAVAVEGMPAFAKMWNESKKEFRTYLVDTAPKTLAALKQKAAKVKAA